MNKETYIELISVSKHYKKLRAVAELSMKVYKGDIYGFLGPNGAGKSTSIRMMLSLISPTSGEIKLFGKDLAHNRYQTLSRIGALIEKPDFYNYLSARKNLQILGKISKVENLSLRIDETLDLVGLLDRGNSKVKSYSQGMRQRLGIAQSLLHNPDLIILDEPANGLDPQGQKEMRQLIRDINREKGITVLISSHILNEIEQIANRMVIIDKGKSVVEGDVQELLNEGEMKVSFFVSNPSKVLQTIQSSTFAKHYVDSVEDKITLTLTHEQVPEITRFLVEKNIEVFAIKPLRSLEEYFLTITKA
ncbi:MAG: ATP-binding cassette domain-containing protein [Bacteroidales bacterium]|nr:ATP-binding cassette domain-containing protein [Bacteroidales bacterium]MCF8457064.1 ATP-binding cassette domain-containing protein [Bacteroidales bacterium]